MPSRPHYDSPTKNKFIGAVQNGAKQCEAANFYDWLHVLKAIPHSEGRNHLTVRIKQETANWNKTLVLFCQCLKLNAGVAPQREQWSAWPGDSERKSATQQSFWGQTHACQTQPSRHCCWSPTTSAITPQWWGYQLHQNTINRCKCCQGLP